MFLLTCLIVVLMERCYDGTGYSENQINVNSVKKMNSLTGKCLRTMGVMERTKRNLSNSIHNRPYTF